MNGLSKACADKNDEKGIEETMAGSWLIIYDIEYMN